MKEGKKVKKITQKCHTVKTNVREMIQSWYTPTKETITTWTRTTFTCPIDDHYHVLAPTLKIYPTIFFISQHMTDPLRHLVCEICENDIPPFCTNCFNA